VSKVKVTPSEASLTLPAASVAVTSSVCLPLISAAEGVMA
jgi:hypothetical protein